MRFDKNCGRVGAARTWTARLTFASLTLATALAWVAPALARIGIAPETRRYCDADGNVAFAAPGIDWKATAATAKDGGKPERVVWSDGSYPYALLSEEDRAFVDAELADFAKEEPKRRAQEEEKRKRLEFYDANGNFVFKGGLVRGATAATAKDGGKPELVFWHRFTGSMVPVSRNTGEPAPDGSYPYALLSEEDRAFVDAELAKYAEDAPKRAVQAKIAAEQAAQNAEEEKRKEEKEAERRKLLEFYDANGNFAFRGWILCERTLATVKEGAEKPERVLWREARGGLTVLPKGENEPAPDGSYPYALLSEEDRAFVDAELAKYAEEAPKRAEQEKIDAERNAQYEKEYAERRAQYEEERKELEFYDANGNLVFTGRVAYEQTAATAKDGGKPERVVWKRKYSETTLDGSFPYALLSEEDRAFVDAELAKFAEETAKRAEEEAEQKRRLEFYDADGSLAFIGVIDSEATLATVQEGAEKPKRVVWANGSYPYALLSEDDRAFVDAALAKLAEQKAAFEKLKKAAAEAKTNWEKEAPQTPVVKRVEGRKFAILIGCDQFEDKAITNLRYAAADMRFLAERLIELGFASNDVVVLTAKKATLDNVYRTLELLTKCTKPGDMIFVAFNGQGFELDGEIYWVPTDADVDDLSGTSVAISDFTEKLEAATPGREKAIFFDACRNIPKKLTSDEQKADSETDDVKPNLAAENIWGLYACESGGLAFEGGALRHGVFTYCFAEGLTREGDANGDGVVTLMEAFFYAKTQTAARVAREFDAEQTPAFIGPFADVEMVDLNAESTKAESAAK